MTWWHGRFGPERRLGRRLMAASGALALATVPFTLLLVLVETSFDPLRRLDQGAAHDLHAKAVAEPAFATAMKAVTDVFQPTTWRVAVGAVVVWLLYRRARTLALWAATTITVGGLLGLGLKLLVARARPHLPDPVAFAPGPSFPSGHTLNATLGAGILLLLALPLLKGRGRAVAWALAVAIPLAVAFTRVALGVHWVSDVLAGLVLGVAVVTATAIAFETWRRDLGRRPAETYKEGVGPEAGRQLSGKGRTT